MGNPVMFFEIAGKDGEALQDFYTALFDEWIILPFGWSTSHFPNDILVIDPTPAPLTDKGIKGHIFPTTDEMPYTNQITFYISVNDLNEAVKNVESRGGKILIPPQEIPDNMGSFAMFIDPSGNILGLHQQ